MSGRARRTRSKPGVKAPRLRPTVQAKSLRHFMGVASQRGKRRTDELLKRRLAEGV